MPDWKEVARTYIADLDLPLGVKDEVVAELAGHLEDCEHETARTTADASLNLSRSKWRKLAGAIQSAKSEEGTMNRRTRSLWLPALITLLGTSLSLTLTQFMGLRPRLIWISELGITLYWPWLASLPLFGAIGSYLSRRAQGSTGAMLAAGLAPALIMLIVLSLVLPCGLAIDGFHFFTLVGFGLLLITWVVIPGMALLLGALPFVNESESARARLA